MNKEIEERVKAYIISCISPRNYLETLDQKLVKTDNSVDETYSIKKVNIDKCINVISDEWLKKFCFEIFHDDRYNRRGVQMTIEELEKKLAELDNDRVKLQEQIKELKEGPIPPHPKWRPKEDDEYWILNDAVESYMWYNDDTDDEYYANSNVFKTREAAFFALERRKVLAEMSEWAGNYNDSFMLTYDTRRSKVFYVPAGDTWIHGEMRFATEKDAENCVKAVGADRIKKYYFMIPEEASND